MRRVFTLIGALALIIIACKKDKFETTPNLKIKSINTNVVTSGGSLDVVLEYTDKEGDLAGGLLTYIRNRTNIKPLPSTVQATDTVHYTIPDFPDKSKAEIEVSIPYTGFLDGDPDDNDTMVFKFAVQDIKGNNSDTILSQRIIAKQK